MENPSGRVRCVQTLDAICACGELARSFAAEHRSSRMRLQPFLPLLGAISGPPRGPRDRPLTVNGAWWVRCQAGLLPPCSQRVI